MKTLFLITIMLLAAWNYTCQAQQINIRKYTIEEGLVNNDVLNIYQDSRGFIWLCTRGGLSRYDGSRFTNYTTANDLTNDMINDIVEIAPQQFIVAQNSDGPRLLKNDRIIPMTPNSKITVNKFYKANNGRLLAATDYDGIVVWDNGNLKRVNPAAKPFGIDKISMVNDSLWLLLGYQRSIQYTDCSLKVMSPALPLNATTIFTDSQGRTWAGTTTGLRLLQSFIKEGKGIDFISLPPPFNIPELIKSFIFEIFEDSKGNFWIGTTVGVVKINKKGETKIFTEKDGLLSSSINCIMEDRANNIWIGTRHGFVKFPLGNEVKTFAPKLTMIPPYNIVYGWPAGENIVRLFNGKNIARLNVNTGQVTNNFPGSLDKMYSINKLNNESLMIADAQKCIIYHSSDEQTEMIRWPKMPFGTTARVDEKNFLIAFGKTVYHVFNEVYQEKLSLELNDIISQISIDKKGFLWIATKADGLFKVHISNTPSSLQLEIIDTLNKRLPDPNIRSLYTDDETEIWAGTRYSGLTRIVELPNGKYEIQNYGTRQGLLSDFVVSITKDAKGNIWAGTLQGVDKLIPSGNKYRIFNFGKLNKIFAQVLNVSFLQDNYLLISGTPYLACVKDQQQDTLPPPTVYITNINEHEKSPRLPYSKAQIYFEFSAPQFINEDFTKYSYRLLGGNDTAWNIAGQSHSVYFANLRPGPYTFEVRAIGFNGKWGDPAFYSFIVNTPFWQKAWFILLVIVTIGMLLYALYRYRVQQLIRLQKVRNSIATNLHDEIGSNLTNISILSNLSKKNLSQPDKASGFLQRISEEVASSSQALDDIIWSVNTNHDTLEETVSRMRRYAAELFDAANISNELHLDPAFEERKLNMEQRRDIYLLYKEAVNNISKHADAKHVSIRMTIVHNQLVLEVKDDGKGFDPDKESSRHGLNGMKERVKKWKGKIMIESVMQKGTTIKIRLPLSK